MVQDPRGLAPFLRIHAEFCDKQATEELHGACSNVQVRVRDVKIDQHFFVQDTSSYPVILGEAYITWARMEIKVLDNGSAYARVKSRDGHHFV